MCVAGDGLDYGVVAAHLCTAWLAGVLSCVPSRRRRSARTHPCQHQADNHWLGRGLDATRGRGRGPAARGKAAVLGAPLRQSSWLAGTSSGHLVCRLCVWSTPDGGVTL